MYAHRSLCAALLYPHSRYELNVQYNALLSMAGCGVPEVGHNLFSYHMKNNCISAHTYNQIPKWKWYIPHTTKLPRL